MEACFFGGGGGGGGDVGWAITASEFYPRSPWWSSWKPGVVGIIHHVWWRHHENPIAKLNGLPEPKHEPKPKTIKANQQKNKKENEHTKIKKSEATKKNKKPEKQTNKNKKTCRKAVRFLWPQVGAAFSRAKNSPRRVAGRAARSPLCPWRRRRRRGRRAASKRDAGNQTPGTWGKRTN